MKQKGWEAGWWLGIVLVFTVCGCEVGKNNKEADIGSPDYHLELNGAAAAEEYFRQNATPIDRCREDKRVSPLFVKALPADMPQLDAEAKKQLFISIMLPLITRENERIQLERNKLLALKQKKEKHSRLYWREQAFLHLLKAEYGVKSDDIDMLLKRVDVIPVSLALAQAIIESGWGTSRFALQGNALFGVHRSAKSNGKYILSKIGRIRVAAYDSIGESTHHYLQLLNSASVYDGLRTRRYMMKNSGEAVSGVQLAATLAGYSEIGLKYVQTLQQVISAYGLEDLDDVKFRDDQVPLQLNII